MTFDYIAWFESRGIFIRTTGPNVSKGHVAIHCPFCGPADPSEHLSVAINGAGWRCWRNGEHSGSKPHRLLMALGLTRAQANAEVGEQAPALADDLVGQVSKLLGIDTPEPQPPQPLDLPKEFRTLYRTALAMPYVNYLSRRGFTLEQVNDFGPLYFATEGDFSGRIIFPVHDFRHRLMGWTGRHVGKNTLRYKDEGPIKNYLWRQDTLARFEPDTLVVSEGPFDALKVSVLGKPSGITGTCFFTSSPSAAQLTALRLIAQSFTQVFALTDVGNETAAYRIAELLPGVIPIRLPDGVADPGVLRDLLFLEARRGAGRPKARAGHHRGS